jgi:TFIIF-interacting CTD phosphatase-like protein
VLPDVQRTCDLGKKTLVLDLDETLVHSTVTQPRGLAANKAIKINWRSSYDGSVERAYTSIRPGVFNFLSKATKMFEVVLFTASTAPYAKQICRLLDKENYNFSLLTRTD